jgi:DNA-binding MarR family transcriptional regulator
LATTPEARARPADRAQTAEIVRLAVARTSRRLRQQAGRDLSPSRAAVLATIARYGPLTPSRLAEIERISRPTITRLVAKLKAQGLVECTPDPGDGRSYQIAVSETGSALRELRRQRKHAYLARLLEEADPEELEQLERSAKVLLRLLEEEER